MAESNIAGGGTGGWRPANFSSIHKEILSSDPHVAQAAASNLDQAIQIMYQSQNAQQAILSGTQSGSVIIRGTGVTPAGTATVSGIDTGLSSVNDGGVIAGVIGFTGIVQHFFVAARPTPNLPGHIDIAVYHPTAAGNTALIPSTSTVEVGWIAVGKGPVAK